MEFLIIILVFTASITLDSTLHLVASIAFKHCSFFALSVILIQPSIPNNNSNEHPTNIFMKTTQIKRK